MEQKEASARGGHKPICLAVNKEYGRFIGIELAWILRGGSSRLSGNILAALRGTTMLPLLILFR